MKRIAVFFLLLLGVPAYGNVRITVDSAKLDFGGHAVGSGEQLVLHARDTSTTTDIQIDDIKPVGPNAGDFQIVAPSGLPTVIARGASLSIIVQFRAGALGARFALLAIVTSDGEIDIPMTGAGQEEVSEVSLSSGSIDFGIIGLNTWRDTILELYSIGRDSATIHDIQVSNSTGDTTFGAWFADTGLHTPFKLAPGDSLAILVQFNGLSVGPVTSEVNVFGGTMSMPACALKGDVEVGLLEYQPSVVDFGILDWGAFRDTTVRLVNTGEVDITIDDVEPITDAEFTLRSPFTPPIVIPAGEYRDILLRAAPALGGAHYTQLQVGSASTIPQFHYLNLNFMVSGSMPLSAPSGNESG